MHPCLMGERHVRQRCNMHTCIHHSCSLPTCHATCLHYATCPHPCMQCGGAVWHGVQPPCGVCTHKKQNAQNKMGCSINHTIRPCHNGFTHFQCVRVHPTNPHMESHQTANHTHYPCGIHTASRHTCTTATHVHVIYTHNVIQCHGSCCIMLHHMMHCNGMHLLAFATVPSPVLYLYACTPIHFPQH